MRRAVGATAVLAFGGTLSRARAAAGPGPGVTPQAALRKLLAGNARYVAQRAVHPHQDAVRRTHLSQGQSPFATVFGCVDSRVPPEIVFDQGLGDLFVIRTAAEVPDKAVLGSIEYGVAELKIPLLVVLGHEKCGAVKASLEAIEHGVKAPSHIQDLVEGIRPAIEHTRGKPGDALDNAVREQARLVAAGLRRNPIIGAAVRAGRCRIVAARYDLDSGRVTLL
jgi:carbonic anhydrase